MGGPSQPHDVRCTRLWIWLTALHDPRGCNWSVDTNAATRLVQRVRVAVRSSRCRNPCSTAGTLRPVLRHTKAGLDTHGSLSLSLSLSGIHQATRGDSTSDARLRTAPEDPHRPACDPSKVRAWHPDCPGGARATPPLRVRSRTFHRPRVRSPAASPDSLSVVWTHFFASVWTPLLPLLRPLLFLFDAYLTRQATSTSTVYPSNVIVDSYPIKRQRCFYFFSRLSGHISFFDWTLVFCPSFVRHSVIYGSLSC